MYRLPDSLRSRLARPLAPVLDTEGFVSRAAGAFVVTVGDVVTQTALDHGIVPRVAVVDGFTQRSTQTADALAGLPEGVTVVEVDNPAAEITEALWSALEAAFRSGAPCVIQVHGEEDLAALPALALAPDGALVCYGQPHQGVVVVTVNEASRALAHGILEEMILISGK